MITILSYNVEYGKKINDIYHWIDSLDKKPQIICFQEFPENEIKNLEKNKILKNQSIYFGKGLSEKDDFFGELTIFDNSEFDLVENSYLDFGPDDIESFYKRKTIKRSAIITVFKKSNKTFSIANIHLTPLALHGKRKKQLEEVIENIEIDKSIILGDFNYSSLLTRGGLVNLMKAHEYKLAGEKLVTNKYKYKIPQQLDYVFYKNLKFGKIEVLNPNYSDHYPVIAQFDL